MRPAALDGAGAGGGWVDRAREGRDVAGARAITVLVVAIAAVARLILARLVPLFPDEAYYWDWSRHIAAGYFDHPPGIALAIRAGTAVLGPTPLGVRVGPILLGAVGALAVAGVARRVAGDRAGLVAAIIASVTPLAAAGFTLATPDAPLLAFQALGLHAVVRALGHRSGSKRATAWWLAAGVALGAALVSKYTAVLFPAAVLLAMVAWRDLRVRLREPGPWLAALVALAVFLPVVLWNAQHGWVSFLFQIRHGLGEGAGNVADVVGRELELLGGQAGLFSPVLLVLGGLAVAAALTSRSAPSVRVMAVTALVPLGFFAYSALSKRVEANWPAVAYPSLIPLIAVTPWRERGRRWLRGGIALAGALSLVVYAQAAAPVLPLRGARDPIARAVGWDAVARSVDSTAAELRPRSGAGRVWIAGTRYQMAAQLAFLARGRPRTFAIGSWRPSEYSLQPGLPEVARHDDALILAAPDEVPGPAVIDSLRGCFGSVRPGARVTVRRGDDVVRQARLWVFDGWKGGCTEAGALATGGARARGADARLPGS